MTLEGALGLSRRPTLLLEHQRLSDLLAGKHRILSDLLPQEARIKAETFLAAQGSDRVRGNAADQASLHLSTQIIQTKKEIDALVVDLDNVRMQLHYST